MTEPQSSPSRQPLPTQLCNLDRLLAEMEQRGLDGIVATAPNNVFYLSGFNGIAHKSDEPRPYAFVLSRHAPEHPILIVADYYIHTACSQPSWVKDVRSFRAVMMPLDLPVNETDVERFIPKDADAPWLTSLQATFAQGLNPAVNRAIDDLGLKAMRVGFDDLRLGHHLDFNGAIADAYDALMSARAVKTSPEIALLKRATAINEQAITRTIDQWERGMTWREFNHAYHMNATALGGFVRDPGGMVWGHPRGEDPAIVLQSGFQDHVMEPGTHVMFDCHGTLDLYCWDGGKTWIIDGERKGRADQLFTATANAVESILTAMTPGVRISELQAIGREAYRRSGIRDADQAIIFFHGLGLSHMDLAQYLHDGTPNTDWQLEEGMVVPVHVLFPGGETQRCWVEEVAHVTTDGGVPFFSWGFDPICS
jgi:Xaa-Pro dipeptidase